MTITSPLGGEDGLSIDSQALFSWIMTRFSYGKGHFAVGVQPNGVPQFNTFDTEKKINELEEEIRSLKEENVTLRSK